METYLSGSSVNVEFAFTDSAGAATTPAAIQWRVIDENEAEIVPWTNYPVAGAMTAAEITVPAVSNTLATGKTMGLRAVELRVTDTGGAVHYDVVRYLIEIAKPLVVMENTFQVYNAALLRAEQMPVESWHRATEDQRQDALIEAYRRVCRLKLAPWAKEVSDQDRIDAPWTGQYGASYLFEHDEYDAARFTTLPESFREAVCFAQVQEAEIILGGDPIGDLARSGLLSHTAGESSSMFRSTKPLDLPVSRKALQYLTGFVVYSVRVAR